jgi:hypothetical protein
MRVVSIGDLFGNYHTTSFTGMGQTDDPLGAAIDNIIAQQLNQNPIQNQTTNPPSRPPTVIPQTVIVGQPQVAPSSVGAGGGLLSFFSTTAGLLTLGAVAAGGVWYWKKHKRGRR